MPNTNISLNMNLPIPVVGVDPGPDWANNVNASLTLVDQHNHSPGQGVQINPAGLSITSDLTFLNNNATTLRSARFSPQVAPLALITDVGCIYESGVDLYYNDGLGNQVRITQGGNVAGSSGSIGGLTSPASATYVSANSTFVWQSDASTPANLDSASIILRNLVANSKGLTLSPPNAMGSDYSIVLPTLPGSASVLSIDSSGNMSANASAVVTGSNIANNTITRSKLTAVDQQISSSCGSFSTSSLTPVDVTNLTVTITTTGRPVIIFCQGDGSGSTAGWLADASASTRIALYDVTTSTQLYAFIAGDQGQAPSALYYMDTPVAGTYQYKVRMIVSTGTGGSASNMVLVAYEL